MQRIIIYRQFFTNADCYKKGTKQTPKGIQVHSTGANNPYLKRYVQPDDGRLGQNKYNNSHNKSGLDVCANAYIGKLDNGTPAIYQTLPWDYRCWLSGSSTKGNANKLGYIGYEICEDNLNDKQYFEAAVMDLSVKLDAYLCRVYNIPVSMIHDHHELHGMGLASNHADISHWLKRYNVTMDDYRAAVSRAINEGIEVMYVEGDKSWVDKLPEIDVSEPIYQATVVAEKGSNVNMRQEPTKNSTIMYKVPLGTTVDVLENVNSEWDKIVYNTAVGYMMHEFLKREGPAPEPTPEPEPAPTPTTPDTITVSREELERLKAELTAALNIINHMLSSNT